MERRRHRGLCREPYSPGGSARNNIVLPKYEIRAPTFLPHCAGPLSAVDVESRRRAAVAGRDTRGGEQREICVVPVALHGPGRADHIAQREQRICLVRAGVRPLAGAAGEPASRIHQFHRARRTLATHRQPQSAPNCATAAQIDQSRRQCRYSIAGRAADRRLQSDQIRGRPTLHAGVRGPDLARAVDTDRQPRVAHRHGGGAACRRLPPFAIVALVRSPPLGRFSAQYRLARRRTARAAPALGRLGGAGGRSASRLRAAARAISHRRAACRGRDSGLVGTKAGRAPLIGEVNAQRITGGFLGVFPLEEDPAHFVVVVSGTTDEDVTRAATALALIDFPYADASTMNIGSLTLPALANYSAPNAVREGSRYRFAELDFQGATLHGFKQSNFNRATLTFWLPPDLYASERDDVVLSLHMVYGAGLREDSVFNVSLNDRFESAIPLNDKNGVLFCVYQVRIPARSFRPGKNVIGFEPHMTSQVSDHCKLGQTENMLITLFDDSTLHIPNAAHYVALPDLTLLSRAGFPYTRAPDGSGVTFQVAVDDAATVAAAWTIAGRLAQTLGMPLYQAKWSDAASAADADVVVIGAQGQLGPEFRRAAPLGLSAEAAAPLQTRLALAERTQLPWWERLSPWAPKDVVLRPAMAEVQQSGGLGRYAALTQFKSPQHAGKTVTLITAADSRTLAAGAHALVRPAVWNNMQGSSMMWLEDGSDVRTQPPGEVYHSGRINVGTRLEYYFSRYPLYGGLVLVLIIVILALLAWLLLARFRRRHHPNVSSAG